MPKIPLASYILRRLHQNGVSHLHGVPGDFSLPFLSHLKTSPVKWLGSCNELNAGYAADGYARIRGLGALSTTYGVGELSAINAIAGSYAERVSVVNIVGSPSRKAVRNWSKTNGLDGTGLMHHMLGRGTDISTFQWMHQKITTDVFMLDDEQTAPQQFDAAIQLASIYKRPVHVSIPSDMADAKVDGEALDQDLDIKRVPDPSRIEEGLCFISERLTQATRPLIIIDGVSERYGLRNQINDLVRLSGIPTVCLQHGLGIVDGDIGNYYGVYTGSLATPELKEYVDSSDFVLLIGPLLSDTGTAGWTAVPDLQNTMVIEGDCSTFRDRHFPELLAEELLEALCQNYQRSSLSPKKYPGLTKQSSGIARSTPSTSSPITQDYLWPRLSSFFRSGDTILLANGTPIIGSRLFDLPPAVRVIASGLWYSVGQMLPAAQGVALALQDTPKSKQWSGRTILLEGDGSFQATAQELSTIIRYKIDCTIFITNNEGYAYERLIEGLEDDFNDVAHWKYTLAPAMMGATSSPEYPVQVFTASSVGEMETILADEHVKREKGLTLVDVKMGRSDVPEYFRKALLMAGQRLRA